MTPKEVVKTWIAAFNRIDIEALTDLYSEDAVNHQVITDPLVGKAAIKKMFTDEFARAEMVCIEDNIFEDGEWVILEWKDPRGLRGCVFFKVQNDKIVFQRGYWDQLSFYKQQNIPF